MEKIMDLVNKLLSVTTANGATENEAITAALKVQQLLAKHGMEMSDVVKVDDDKIVEYEFDAGHTSWKAMLAKVVADNFCCKAFSRNKRFVVFYGYERHSKVAREVFKYMYEYGTRKANALYARRIRSGLPTKGIRNQFYIGFVEGVKQALDKQCTALALVIPQEVEESFVTRSADFRHYCTNTRYCGDDGVYQEGITCGKHSVQDRTLTC